MNRKLKKKMYLTHVHEEMIVDDEARRIICMEQC
jgi:hypothetical protein